MSPNRENGRHSGTTAQLVCSTPISRAWWPRIFSASGPTLPAATLIRRRGERLVGVPTVEDRERSGLAALEAEARSEAGKSSDHPVHIDEHRIEMHSRVATHLLVVEERETDDKRTDLSSKIVQEAAELLSIGGGHTIPPERAEYAAAICA